jgi:hypothetical protein
MKVEVFDSKLILAGSGDDVVELPGGKHDLEEVLGKRPAAATIRSLAAAEAAGACKVTASADDRAKLDRHVESDADSRKARTAAQESGVWWEGQLEQYENEVAAGVRTHTGPPIDRDEYLADRKGMVDR